MKRLLLGLQLLTLTIATLAQNTTTVNAIIGDESFLAVFGQQPHAATNETLRLQTHLAYVEALLVQKDVSHLSKTQRDKRSEVLQLLHTYWQKGLFPANYAYPGRRPCFIDRDGAICAVGYLIEQTAGRELAEAINQKHQYDFLLDMNEPAIAAWAEAHGLTLEECATIQPSYGFFPPDRTVEVPVKTGYGIASGAVFGLNAGATLVSLHPRLGGNRTAAYIGLAGGTAQIVMGLANIRRAESTGGFMGPVVTTSYKAQNNLSYLNIAAGTATLFTSAFNLLLNSRIRNKRHALAFFSAPAGGQMMGGFSIIRAL